MIFRWSCLRNDKLPFPELAEVTGFDVKASLQNTFSSKCHRTSSVALVAEKVTLKVDCNSSRYTFSSIGKGNRLKVFCKIAP